MSDEYSDLAEMTRARYQAAQLPLRAVLERERHLRARLAALEQQHQSALSRLGSGLSDQRFYGGDVLWQGWIGRARRQLQMELAQVLAEKGRHLRTIGLAHGRKLAAEGLTEAARQARKAKLEKWSMEREQSLYLMGLWHS